MKTLTFHELGFPVLLLDPKMIQVRGEEIPDVNMRTLQHQVFCALITKRSRLSGDELRFVRKVRRMRQADLAKILHLANHSRVSQWEAQASKATGMEYNSEVVLRLWMAREVGLADQLSTLLDGVLADLRRGADGPVEIDHQAA